ncbi:MAG: hypothetical protein EPO52_15240 [Herbiconiux sp.]|uniref:hypothetical protein n=1 Tax=Herbiconiux sp. TaxID=1871186 RepID=UPI00121F1BE9|nr:hypothetical protein [Herbiconiux sp.]TAJ46883.1 MAG: hypothetical protein EPO52_15240 [Herbiconiux sp.]
MSQRVRVIVASILLVIAVLGLAAVASQIPATYYQAPDDSGLATKQVAFFGPAIVGTVVASLAVVALATHLIVVLRRPAARWMWISAAVCTLLAVGAPIVVGVLDRPVF